MTSTLVTFGLYELEINSDSMPAAEDLQTFSKIEDLKSGNVAESPYITYEPNFWQLDGGYRFFPDDVNRIHVGMMSTAMSDENGDFDTDPVLTITFSHPHTTDGLVLRFSQYTEDWADSITVAYYDIDNVLITTNNYAPDDWEFEIDQDVVNFAKIIITFHATNKPYRYLRVTGIDYGQLITWTDSEILSANVTEEINMLGVQLPTNTCDVKVYSKEDDFSIVNPTGYYARLKDRQPLSVYEYVGTTRKFIGRYFLDEWKSPSEKMSEFKCFDAVGVMGRINFNGGLWLPEGIASQDLIEMLMTNTGIPYELDADLYDIQVIGYLPICTCRAALQQICVAIGAFANCSRTGLVKIRPAIILQGTEDYTTLTNAQQGEKPSLDIKSLVTNIELTAHDYALGADSITAYDGILAVGQYEIPFQQPLHTLTITGAKIKTSGPNYAKIAVSTEGQVTLTGLNYIDNQHVYNIYNPLVGSYVLPNVVTISTATLIHSDNVAEVANRMFGYYQQRYIQKLGLFSPTIAPGSVLQSDTQSNTQLLGVVEKMSIDLTGGFRANAEVTGVII
jgi:hypothetical protein